MSAPPTGAADLSALVSARLCHDLISPMGAIGNGLELLQMSEGRGAAEMDLITDSLATAMAKLRFYRLAFGPADAHARQSLDEARQITDAMFTGRFAIRWQTGAPNMSRVTARLVYLAILCMERSLPMGGAMRITFACDHVEMAVEGCRLQPPSGLWPHVCDGAPLTDPRPDNVQFALLRNALATGEHAFEARFTQDAALLRLGVPAMAQV